MLSELRIFCELAGNLELSGVQKAIYEEIDQLKYDSILNVNLIKKMIGEVSNEALRKRKELMNIIKKELYSSNPNQKLKDISTDSYKKIINDINIMLNKNSDNSEELFKSLISFKEIRQFIVCNEVNPSSDKGSFNVNPTPEDTLKYLNDLKIKIKKESCGLIKDENDIDAIQKVKFSIDKKIAL